MPGTDDISDFNAKNIIFAGYGIEDKNYNDYAGLDIKGKIVVAFTGEPKLNGNLQCGDLALTKKLYLPNKKEL